MNELKVRYPNIFFRSSRMNYVDFGNPVCQNWKFHNVRTPLLPPIASAIKIVQLVYQDSHLPFYVAVSFYIMKFWVLRLMHSMKDVEYEIEYPCQHSVSIFHWVIREFHKSDQW